MRNFLLRYLIPRLAQYVMVIFLGVTLTFAIPRLSPNDPVERQVGQMMMSGAQVNPEAVIHLREALTEMYGLKGSSFQQYLAYWGRLLRGDLGPSLSTFPTPVTELIARAMPWTIGLLLTAVLISWVLGNLFGGLASYYPDSPLMRVIDVLSQAVRPIPYYVMALVMLILFAYVIPIFPFSGAYPAGMRVQLTPQFVLTVLKGSALPAISLVIVGMGGWFLGMKSLTSNIISEDYVVYAENAGLSENKILFNYVMRNALLPQITGLALQLGMIFNGALIMEVVFGYPGMGMLTLQAVMANDYSLIMGIAIFSIIGVATSVLILDLIYPLFDPRVRHQQEHRPMLRVIRDLLKYDGRFRIAFVFLLAVLILAVLSVVSPYDPERTFKVPADQPPSLAYPFGTNSRGQDIFWWMAFAVRNSLFLGLVTAIVSRVLAIFVGLTAGYRGGLIDRVLMSINDSFVVMPVLPILILLSFLLRGRMSLVMLALILGLFGWPWDARLIRAQVLSLKERSFTRTAVYSGTGSLKITLKEHLPFVLPVVFATTINNMLWSIGMEVTLSVLGLSNVSLATLGTAIFWANQHQALVAGIWWWIAAPVVVAIILFLGLYMLFSSVNEYIDPRTRLRLMGG